jgi:hypothetical protein
MLIRRRGILVGTVVACLLLGDTAALADDRPSTQAHVTALDGTAAKTEVASGVGTVRRSRLLPKGRLVRRSIAPVRSALGRASRAPVYSGRVLEVRKICETEYGPNYGVMCSGRVFAPPTPRATPQRRAALAARELALRAVNLLRLPAPRAEVRPMVRFRDGAHGGLTGAPLWLWIPGSQWRTLHQRTEAGAAWAEVTAQPVSQTWTFGDGSRPVTCFGRGTELTGFNVHRALEGSPSCGYTYTVSSKDQPQQRYTVDVTVNWQLSWIGSGDTGGILPLFALRQTFPYTVRQARAQLVDPDN